jgi:histidinol-phosphate aminotransferase
MKIHIKKNIQQLMPYQPGKPIEELSRELDIPIDDIVKLASNENPVGISPKAARAIRGCIKRVNRYPDGSCFYIKKKLSAKLGVKESNLIIGNGSDEILDIIAKAFLYEGEQAIITEPCFLEYEIVVKMKSARVVKIPMIRDYESGILSGFRYDINKIISSINSRTKIIYLGNPDNPTGAYLKEPDIKRISRKCPKNVIIVIDEAYRELVSAADYTDTKKYIKKHNVIILRTFSKAYGLAGLRIGYAIAKKELVSWMDRVRQPFNVNMIAQIAALAAIDDTAHVERVKHVTKNGRDFLIKNLENLGFHVIKAPANFILFAGKNISGTQLFLRLLPRGIIIRDMKPYGLSDWARVSVGTMKQNRRFIKELQALGLGYK